MPKFLLSIIISLSFSVNSVSSNDLIEFDSKFYLANSYKPYSGELIDYYKNGMVKLQGDLNKGKKIGSWFEFHMNGALKSQIYYNKNTVRISYFDENQKIQSTGMKINNNKNGLWIYFDDDGNEMIHSFYSNGILDSTVNLSDIKEIEDKTSQVVHDIIEIDTTQVNENHTTIDTLQIKNGEFITYYDSGRYLIENYKDGVLNGLHTVYHNNGYKSIERFFINGNLDTITNEYNEMGILISKYHEYLDKNNIILKNGEYISYHLNGMIYQKGIMISGYRYGLWVEYNDKGEKNREIYYDVNPLSLNQEYIESKISTYYDNGIKFSEYMVYTYTKCTYSNEECSSFSGNQLDFEIKNGNYSSYYKNGQIKFNGAYLNNIKIEIWIEYYINGGVKSITEYSNGIGHYTSYFEDYPERISETGYYKNHNKIGEWNIYNPKGEIVKNYYMDENMIDINYPVKIYYESFELDDDVEYNQQLKLEFYCSGIPDDYIYNGTFKRFFPNNNIETIGIYKNNNKFGKWEYFYNDGSLNKEITLDEYGNGDYKSYYLSGEILSLGNYLNYLREGKWIFYYKNNKIEWIIFYLHNKINPNQLSSNWYISGYKKSEGYLIEYDDEIIWDDKYVEYYENGIILREGYYNRGKKNGRWTEYYDNRVRKSLGNYMDDIQIGEWEFYSNEGILIEKIYFE